VKEGYLTNRLLDPQQGIHQKKKKCYAYRLTECGKLAGETILSGLDAELCHSLLKKNSSKSHKNDSQFTNTLGVVAVNENNNPPVDVTSCFIKKIHHPQLDNLHTPQKELTDNLLDYFCLEPSNSALTGSQHNIDIPPTPLLKTPETPPIQTKSIHSSSHHDANDVSEQLQSFESESHVTLLSKSENATTQEELLLGLLRYIEENTLERDAFCIVCLVDHREAVYHKNESMTTVTTKQPVNKIRVAFCEMKTFILKFLVENNLKYESTLLPIGDFTWVCRLRKPKELFLSTKLQSLMKSTIPSTNEYHSHALKGYDQNIDFILPYLVERKTVSDFIASIMDGRFLALAKIIPF
jgi:hypothetical protein